MKRGLVLSALLGILIGSSGYTMHYAEGLSYMSNDPAACVNCHIMRDQYDGWQKSSHHAFATCNDCHTPQEFLPKYLSKARNGFVHSKGFTFQDFPEPIRIRPVNREILVRNCVRCHHELVSHLRMNEDLSCVRCHERVGHGPVR